MVLSILEAHVPQAQEPALRGAYADAARDAFPPGLIRSMLLRTANDPTLWRIETLWESREALVAMRGSGTPRGILIFRAAGAEPVVSILDVVATLSPSGDAA
jgi:heme-degrading monooxygenase HmoA